MSEGAPSHRTTPEAQLFLRVLRWGEPIIPATALLFVAFAALYESPLHAVGAAYLAFVFWPMARWARSLTARNRLQKAVLGISLCFWGLATLVAMAGKLFLAASVLCAILPVVISLPFATQRLMFWISLGATFTAGLSCVIPFMSPILSIGSMPERDVMMLVGSYCVLLTGFYSFVTWQSRVRLTETLDEMRSANEALGESERSLERKVAQRTAELAEARDEALAATRTKSAFLANMSHELRTPLNAIIGYSEMLREEAEEGGHEALVPDLNKVVAAGRHLLGLINDVLDLSKIEAGRMELFAERFSLAEVLEGVASTVQPLVEKNKNRLVLDLPADLGTMHSDVTKLRQVLFNLLSNASKFTREGELRLAARRSERDGAPWIEIHVADTGIGMSPEQLARVFEAFTQADASTTREFGGTGLGLAITKSFCTMLGGEIIATSEAGRGSEFVVRLPAELAEPVAAAEHATRPLVAGEREGSVLVIDDDEQARELLTRFLAREGLRVVTAATGAEGLRLARELRPRLITLDVLMPGMHGWSVLAELKADPELAEIPVVVVSITDDPAVGYALGASEYLTKPVDRERLSALMRRYLPGGESGPVLIVEDDPLSRSLLRGAIEKLGGRVVEAENGSVGLARLREERPCLVLLDLMMPVMDGFQFLEELRRQPDGAAIPVVVVTAKDLTLQEREALGLQRDRVLAKGGRSRDSLLAEVRALVRAQLGGA